MNRAARFLVFETGGAKLVAAVADPTGALLAKERLTRDPADQAETSLARLLECGERLLRKYSSQGSRCQAVGFGYGGAVDRESGRPLACLHEPGWERIDLRRRVFQRFALPVFLENDCKLAALAEARLGAGRGAETVFYMTLGSGVGGGIVHRGRIQTFGPVGEAEIGHIVVEPDGPPCPCGGRGCLEAVASGPGILRLASWLKERTSADPYGVQDPKEIFSAWRAGEPFAAAVVERAALLLSRAAAATVNLIAPQRFVIGGGVGSGNPDFVELTARYAVPQIAPYFRDRVRIVVASLGEDVVCSGAALLAAQTSGQAPRQPENS